MEKANFKLSLWNWVVVFCKGKFGGGVSSVLEYILNIFNDKVLSKVSPEELKKYSGLIVALAEFGEKVLNIYVIEPKKRKALSKTVDTLRKLADSLSDGNVTADELETAINDVIDTINAWKSIKNIEVKDDSSATIEAAETFVPESAN